MVTALPSHQCGFVGSRLAPRVFLQVLRFSSLHKKTTSPNSVLTGVEHAHENQLRLMRLPNLFKATNLGYILCTSSSIQLTLRNVFQAGRVSQKSFCKANLVKCHSTEITGSTAGTSDSNYIDKEAQRVGNMDDHRVGVSLHGQAPDKATEGDEDDAITSLSRSSSSEGIWPSSDAVQRGYQERTSTIGMLVFVNLSFNMTCGRSILFTECRRIQGYKWQQ